MKKTGKMIAATAVMCIMMIAGAVIASRMGISSTHIALGISLFMCFGEAVALPMMDNTAHSSKDQQ